eukprot:13516436-Alexandrium_andersonii.AAC.1
MSASLVGSEMCIRDRDRAAPLLRNVSPRGSRGVSTEPRRSRCVKQLREPVSYTHLTLPTICSV